MDNVIRSIASIRSTPVNIRFNYFWEVTLMSLSKMFRDTVGFFSDAVSRVFGLDDDNYPPTGIQPFSGDVADKKHRYDK
jgi:hypothetical protein